MGHAATHGADVVVVTSDNPRSEDPDAIIREILSGADGPAEVLVEADRAKAIHLALDEARAGDVVVIAGKGHERTQKVGNVEKPFDDREVAGAYFGKRGND